MASSTETESISVFVVEDNIELTNLYASWGDGRYTVEAAHTGKETINKILEDEFSFDVVLLDRQLPDLDYTEVLEVIHRHRETRVALLTAVTPETDIVNVDIDAYIRKPIDKTDFCEIVERLYSRTVFTADLTRYYALAEKRATLQRYCTESDLANDEQYHQLAEEMKELETKMAETVDFNDPLEVEQIIQEVVNDNPQ